MPHKTLTDTLQILESETGGNTVVFKDLAQALNRRGFGPLLIAPAILIILPTGAIPGIPALCGVFIFLMASQILMGRHHPWLPRGIKNFSFERSKMVKAINAARPYTQKADKFIRPRLKFFTRDIATPVVAAICAVLSLAIIFMGFIPMLPALISLPILFFGLGISAKDGVMTLLGLLLTALTPFAVLFLMNGMQGEETTIPLFTL